MNRLLPIFYAVAILLHAMILFWLKPPAPQPPKIIQKTFIDVALTTPPPETPKPPTPPPVVPPPKEETPPPKPEIKPEPIPPPQPVMTIPEPKPEPPPKVVLPPVVTPPPVVPPPPPQEYVQVAEPKYAQRAEPLYPTEARRRHQQGVVQLELFISETGALDKVEIVKSSGFPLLDAAAIKAMRQSQFDPATSGMDKIRSRAEATVTFKLE